MDAGERESLDSDDEFITCSSLLCRTNYFVRYAAGDGVRSERG